MIFSRRYAVIPIKFSITASGQGNTAAAVSKVPVDHGGTGKLIDPAHPHTVPEIPLAVENTGIDILADESDLSAEKGDLPRPLEPDQKKRQHGKGTVNPVVFKNVGLKKNEAVLKHLEKYSADDARQQSAPETDLCVGRQQIDQCKDGNGDHQRRQIRRHGKNRGQQ